MSEWKETAIRHLAFSYAGGTPSRAKSEYFGGNIPWISSSEVNQSSISEVTEKITEKGLKYSSAKWVPADSVLIAMYGATAGQVAYLKIRATTNQAVLALIPKDSNVDSKFLYYQVNFNKDKILYHAQGSGQPNLNKQIIDRTHLLFPSLAIQRKIACILSTIDGQIEKTEAIIAKYQAVKQGMLQDLFTRGIDVNTGQLRPRYEDAPDLYKESALGMIPKEWEVTTLKNYMLEARGYIQTGPFGSQLHSHEYVLDGVPVIMPQDINEFTISTEIIARIPQRKADSLGRHKVRKNDVVFARRGDVSRCTIIDEEQIGWLCGTGCILMRFDKRGVISPDWFKIFYKSEKSQNQVIANSVGSMMVNLNSKVLNDLKIYRLSYEEQLSIVSVLNNNDKSLINLTNVLSKLQLLKQGLMQDLLSGKVEVGA